jgi:hypothetical protein
MALGAFFSLVALLFWTATTACALGALCTTAVGLALGRVEAFTFCAGTLDAWLALVFACASAALGALAALTGLAGTTLTALDETGTETAGIFADVLLGVAVLAAGAVFALAVGAALPFTATGWVFAGAGADGF